MVERRRRGNIQQQAFRPSSRRKDAATRFIRLSGVGGLNSGPGGPEGSPSGGARNQVRKMCHPEGMAFLHRRRMGLQMPVGLQDPGPSQPVRPQDGEEDRADPQPAGPEQGQAPLRRPGVQADLRLPEGEAHPGDRRQQQLLRPGPESASEDHGHEDKDRPADKSPGCPEGTGQGPGRRDAEAGGRHRHQAPFLQRLLCLLLRAPGGPGQLRDPGQADYAAGLPVSSEHRVRGLAVCDEEQAAAGRPRRQHLQIQGRRRRWRSGCPAEGRSFPGVCLRLKQQNQDGRRPPRRQQCRATPDVPMCSDDDWVSRCPSGCRLQGLIQQKGGAVERKLWTACQTAEALEDAAEKSMRAAASVYKSQRRLIVGRYTSELKFAELAQGLSGNLTSLRKRTASLSRQLEELSGSIREQMEDLQRTEVDVDMKLRTCRGSCRSALPFDVDHSSYQTLQTDMDETLSRRTKTPVPPPDVPHIKLDSVGAAVVASGQYKTIPTVQRELLTQFEDIGLNRFSLEALDAAELE